MPTLAQQGGIVRFAACAAEPAMRKGSKTVDIVLDGKVLAREIEHDLCQRVAVCHQGPR